MCSKNESKAPTDKRPDPKILGTGMANKAAKTLRGRQKRIELSLKEAGA